MITVTLFKKMHSFDLDISFNIDTEVLVLEGPSGAGKSTILDCIAGIKTPNKGRICIDNNIVFDSNENINMEIRNRGIGYVFQNYALFPHLTVRKNIEFGLKCKKIHDTEYLEYIMHTLKIKHLENRYPKNISGGEKQRVALCRALVINPNILLLDEPFSALDTNTKETVYSEFLEIKKMINKTIILVTHDKNEALLLGDRIIKIDKGIQI